MHRVVRVPIAGAVRRHENYAQIDLGGCGYASYSGAPRHQSVGKYDPIHLLQQVEEIKRQRKLERMSAFNFMVGLQTSLVRGLAKSLHDFAVPQTCIVRPLEDDEVRFRDPATGRMSVYNKATRMLKQDSLGWSRNSIVWSLQHGSRTPPLKLWRAYIGCFDLRRGGRLVIVSVGNLSAQPRRPEIQSSR